MKKLTTTLQGLDAWTELFHSPDKFCAFADVDIQIQLFADGDATWMLLSHYTSDTSSTDYTFMPANVDELSTASLLTFDFLKNLDYSLPRLLAWLETTPFSETEMADEVVTGKIKVTRQHARATAPVEKQTHDASAITFEEYDDEKNPG